MATEEATTDKRTRRTIPELIEGEQASITYHEEKILAAQLRIGKLKDRQLEAERAAATKEMAAKLDEVASRLSPQQLADLLQKATADAAVPA